MTSIFENTFVIGLIIGLVLFPLVDWLGDKARPKIKKEPEKEVTPENPKRKHIRDFCINLTHYTADQLKEVYDLLRELKEPISTVYKDYKDWWEDGYDPDMYKSTLVFDFLAFGNKSWGVMTDSEITCRKIKRIELHDFIIMLRIKIIEKENPRYQLWEYFEEQHNLILIESEIDEIIYHVNNINYGKSKIITAS